MKKRCWLVPADVGVFHYGWSLERFLERVAIYFHASPYALPLMLPYYSESFAPFPMFYYY